MSTIGKYVAIVLAVLVVVVFAAWKTAPDPQYNPASFESEPLEMGVAPLEKAITLAQFLGQDGQRRTMIVLTRDGETVTGIDLAQLGAGQTNDPFEALAGADLSHLRTAAQADLALSTLDIGALLPVGSPGSAHIGTGTNFPEHAEEASSTSVFQFPKFGPASAARTQVRADRGILLDYEVELCMRFDRDISTIADFDEAVKGVFLCGDFTNRNALINLADPDNLDSGRGFSDAKSGPDFFPTGPFLVIPDDWKPFVANVRMTTAVNGAQRQDARGREMTLDFRGLAEKALSDMQKPRFLYRDNYVKLTASGSISSATTLMSGTSEGTIFTPPTRADIIEAIVTYASRGGPFAQTTFLDLARQTFIANELAGQHYLQPDDVVHYASNSLGDIVVRVVD